MKINEQSIVVMFEKYEFVSGSSLVLAMAPYRRGTNKIVTGKFDLDDDAQRPLSARRIVISNQDDVVDPQILLRPFGPHLASLHEGESDASSDILDKLCRTSQIHAQFSGNGSTDHVS